MLSETPGLTILYLAANPKDTGRLRLDEEVREIQEGLQLAVGRETIRFETQWAIRSRDLRRSLLRFSPQIVHFSGHGAGSEGLVLEDEAGYAHCIQAENLAQLLRLCPTVQCVLLNACYSEVQAKSIAEHVPYVIGMNQAIGDETAIKFAVGFYDALGYGRPFTEAYEFGMTAIEAKPSIIMRDINSYPEPDVPLPKKPVVPVLIVTKSAVPPGESNQTNPAGSPKRIRAWKLMAGITGIMALLMGVGAALIIGNPKFASTDSGSTTESPPDSTSPAPPPTTPAPPPTTPVLTLEKYREILSAQQENPVGIHLDRVVNIIGSPGERFCEYSKNGESIDGYIMRWEDGTEVGLGLGFNQQDRLIKKLPAWQDDSWQADCSNL
jgi:hypothetical protein